MPRISVIMGIYNVENTLTDAVNSLLKQTYQDFNVIMCDDGSNDHTLEIADEFAKRYPDKFLVLRNEHNMGLNFTLNRCLEFATGEYVARMDGDDLCDETRFEKQVLFLDQHPEYAVVSSLMTMFDDGGSFRTTAAKEKPQRFDLKRGNPFCHAAVMIRSEAYRKVGGYTVNKRMLRVEDVDLWFKLYAMGYKGYNIQEPLYLMRDDRNAVARRRFKYRINSTYTRLVGFSRLKMPWYYYPYTLEPMIIGLIPRPIYVWLHKIKNR